MKLLSVLVFVAVAINGLNALPNRQAIEGLLKKIQQKLVCGYDGLPVLNPLYAEELHFETTGALAANMHLKNLYVVGVTDFTVQCTTPLPITLNLDWPNGIYLSTEYEGSLNVLDQLKLFGKGTLSLFIDGISINQLQIIIGKNNATNGVTIEALKLKENGQGDIQGGFTGTPHASITGLFNDDQKSEYITNDIVDVLEMLNIKENMKQLLLIAQPLLKPLIESQIDLTYDDIMGGNMGPELPKCLAHF